MSLRLVLMSCESMAGCANRLSQREFVRHVETTLARSLYNCDELCVRQVPD